MQIFEQFKIFLIEELSEKRLLKNRSLENGIRNVLNDIVGSSIIIVSNLLYYYEPSIQVFREGGMMSIARNIRATSNRIRQQTDALLVMAYLRKEGEDKTKMEMSDEELSFLIGELGKSMEQSKNNPSSYTPEELLLGLNRIAVIDKNKLKVIKSGILPLLKEAISASDSPKRQEAAIKTIWNLAFTQESKQKIKEQEGLMSGAVYVIIK